MIKIQLCAYRALKSFPISMIEFLQLKHHLKTKWMVKLILFFEKLKYWVI